MWQQSFIVEGKYLGETPRTYHPETGREPLGYCFFCQECSRLWALCPILGQPSQVLTRPCLQHPMWKDFGSLWTSWDRDFTEAWPADVLTMELGYLLDKLDASEELPCYTL